MAMKPTRLALAVALGIALPGVAAAEISTFGFIKNETSVFTMDGQPTGSESSAIDDSDSHDRGDLLKFENSARLFINGDITDDIVWHGDINIIYDSEAIDDGGVEYEGHRLYSQHDWLRELYLDIYAGDWDVRVGKQQIVWGTADGIKLLDIVNPTDFREVVQNDFEDSRIPIWMVKAERNIFDASNIQFIVSQVEENKFPGLNSDGDAGHPFIFKGVDTITGQVNGFLNIAPALANVASSFSTAAFGGGFDTDGDGAPNPIPIGLSGFTGLTVDGFAGQTQFTDPTGQLICANPMGCGPGLITPNDGKVLLNGIAQNGLGFPNDPNANNNRTNLLNTTGPTPPEVIWDPSNPTSAFGHMPNATFATFNTFGTSPTTPNRPAVQTSYVRDYPDKQENANAGFRFRQRLPNGFNYSVNYFYHYDANPSVDISWHEIRSDGTKPKLVTELREPGGGGVPTGALVSRDNAPRDLRPGGDTPVTVLLRNPNTNQLIGAFDPDGAGPLARSANPAELRFTESLNRIHSIGASFDYGVSGFKYPMVIRGEFLYDKDTLQPVVDKRLLAVGDLEGALRPEEQDIFKYVIGVDVTVLTNLLVSGQFIQFRNLDFEDKDRTCFTQTGAQFDCSRYTADFASMSVENSLKKDNENQEFYSLFLSKPFGPSDEHRWNNIFIYEEDGGKWNRFDVEYTFTDLLIGTAQWNHYWGDEDTQFGQFKDSSSFQVGLRYIFE